MTPEQGQAYDLEVVELGDRVSLWLTYYQFASIYSTEHDRIWSTILCFVGCIRSVQEHIPSAWLPELDEFGTWIPHY